jgi:rfaE bifunctional protein nucleotidyltransferase chain/domain
MQSAALGDVLVIAVNSDESVRALKGPDRPVNSQNARAFALSCLRFVDAVFIFPGPRLADEILALRPDIYTKAGDYTLDSLDPSERDSLLATGAEIHILPLVQNISTTKIIEAIRSHP